MSSGDDPLDSAWLFAALSGPFEPKRALLARANDNDPVGFAMAATRLAEVCDTSPAGAGGRWLMRTPARHALLLSLGPGELQAAARARWAGQADSETEDLLAVLLDRAPLSRRQIQAIVDTGDDLVQLERVVIALDRAGEAAPARDLLPRARSAIAELRRAEHRRRVAERGFFGRDRQCEEIAAWLSRPIESAPVTCLFVTAGPGMGKSTLLAESVRRYHEAQRPLTIRLDFDRAGLDVLDLVGLTMEAARQLAEQLGTAGPALFEARLKAGRAERGTDGRSMRSLRSFVPDDLVSHAAAAVAATGRPVLIVLDTLEVLRGRGETHPARLFDWLDALVAKGVKPMRVLAAGRSDALGGLREIGQAPGAGKGAPERYRRLLLPGLEDAAAEALLDRLRVPPGRWRQLLDLAQGNPLKLRLGAEIAKRTGVDKLPPRRAGDEVSAAFLYRFLLSRIEDPALKRLAHPGLIVRRINAALIREVLAPRLGLGRISEERAQALLTELATHHWLVEYDAGTGFLKHRSDMRMLLLPLLYRTSPALSARIDAAAVPWFAALPEPWARLEAVYHQLQLTRRGGPPPSVPGAIAAQFDADMLDELPPAAADLVRSARGERTSQLRGTQPQAIGLQDDPGLANEIQAAVERRDWFEGAHMVRRIVEAGTLDVVSRTADAVRTYLWRSGQWAEARRWLIERDRFLASDDDLADLPPAMALARLEMRAEFDPDGLRRRWRTRRDDVQRLVGSAFSSGDNVGRHGPLGFLLAEEPERFRFQRADKAEADLVAAARDRWCAGGGAEFSSARESGRERLAGTKVPPSRAAGVRDGRLLATLTPYAAPAGNLSVLDGHGWLREAAATAAAVLARAGGLFDDAVLDPLDDPRSEGAMAWLTDVGLFAEWAEAIAFVRRDRDLQLIGRAAERWRRTVAGDWTFGRRRGAWRTRPPLDETLRERLLQTPAEAMRQLGTWAAALGTDVAALERRLAASRNQAARLSMQRASPEFVALRLLTRGVPAAFAPSLVQGASSGAQASVSQPDPIPVRAGSGGLHQPGITFKEARMNDPKRLEALRARITPEVEVAVREAIAAARLPVSLMNALSQPGREALSTGESLESVAMAGTTAIEGLEAIIKRVGRPPLLVRNDAVVLEPMPLLPAETPALIRGVEKWVPSVGRIEFRNHDMAWGGTGWVAEKRGNGALVVTNRHVASLVARRKADGSAVFMRAPSGARYGAAIDFGEEVDSQSGDTTRTALLTRIEYLADNAAADVALLFIEAAGFALPSAFDLVPKDELARDDLVALVGYPAYDSRNDASDQARYFRDLYEVKRFAPGRILQAANQGVITYDCTSLGGNSGSPLIRLADGKVAGLHFSGVYGERNTAVSAGTLRALIQGERPVSVSLYKETHQEAADGSHAARHFEGRQGFSTKFLKRNAGAQALATPWPGIRADLAQDLAQPSDNPAEPNELRYTHFGVKYSAKLKAPLITAVNIDGQASVRIKRGDDKWFADERIPRAIQLNAKHFKDPEIDRGHMVRREDPNWGPEKDAQLANDDTFHYVNAAAQHSRLNQGKELWQGLENYILDSARTHGFKACVFTGPVLRDPEDDEEEIVLDGAVVPVEFWKVVVTLNASDMDLHATAYLLSQGQLIRKLLERRGRREGLEGMVLGAYRTFQVAISDLAEATGYDFGAYVGADPLRRMKSGQEAIERGEPVFVPLDQEGDIIL